MRLLSLTMGLLFLSILFMNPIHGHAMADGQGAGCGMRAGHMETKAACGMHYGGCSRVGQGTGCWHHLYHEGVVDRLEAEKIIGHYLRDLGNPNVKQGEIKETEQAYVIDIVTKEHSLVETLRIDKETGHITVTY